MTFVSSWRECRLDSELDDVLLLLRFVAVAQCAKVAPVQVGPG